MLKTRTILTIDNDPKVLDTVEQYLNTREYKVVTAQRWTEAITQLTEASPDAVLLDLHLPTVQGEALLEFIRENHAELPVVIISSGATPTEMARLGELGANGFIRKPFDTEDLIVILEQVLLDLSATAQPESHLEPPQIEPDEDHFEDATEATPVVDNTEDVEVPQKAKIELPPNITPGSGIHNLPRFQPPPQQKEVRRKRKKKRRSSRKTNRRRKIRNFAIIIILFLAMGYLTYHFRQSLDTNFIGGISFGVQKSE